MKNMRCLPLNLRDFCLIWLIMGIFDRNRIKTWKHGPRKGVLDREGDIAAGTADIPQWEGRKTYTE